MTTFSIILFFFALSVVFAMTAHKIWLLRIGRIIPGSYEEADWTDLSIESVRMRLGDIARYSSRTIALLALKSWIKLVNFIRRTDRKVKVKLVELVHKNSHATLDTSVKPTQFIQDMHKEKEAVAEKIGRETGTGEK